LSRVEKALCAKITTISMSGHSKWSTIKRQKGATDAKRGQAFTKATNAITIAARQGADPESNFKLRLAVEQARALNMPKENIERAISRGSGTGKEAQVLEEVTYEGYGQAGVAIMVETVTDNRQRTAQEVRSVFERGGGTLAGPGSVAHYFSPVGEVEVKLKAQTDPDQVLLDAADAGAQDVDIDKEVAVVYCAPDAVTKVKESLLARGYEVVEARLSKKPSVYTKVTDDKVASGLLSLLSKLEDLNDVQKVYSNFDVPQEIMERSA
jgi:YebC/PmpR family DNA-binding regulatory protein